MAVFLFGFPLNQPKGTQVRQIRAKALGGIRGFKLAQGVASKFAFGALADSYYECGERTPRNDSGDFRGGGGGFLFFGPPKLAETIWGWMRPSGFLQGFLFFWTPKRADSQGWDGEDPVDFCEGSILFWGPRKRRTDDLGLIRRATKLLGLRRPCQNMDPDGCSKGSFVGATCYE